MVLEIPLFSEVAPIIKETQNPMIIKAAKHRQIIETFAQPPKKSMFRSRFSEVALIS